MVKLLTVVGVWLITPTVLLAGTEAEDQPTQPSPPLKQEQKTQSDGEDAKTMTGVWQVTISPKAGPKLLSIALFGDDGSFTTKVNAKLPAMPPFAGFADEVGPGYGRWLPVGSMSMSDGAMEGAATKFSLTFYAVLLKDGVVNGYQRVRATMNLSESGDEFEVHEGSVDFLDLDWKVVASGIDEVIGKRLETSE